VDIFAKIKSHLLTFKGIKPSAINYNFTVTKDISISSIRQKKERQHIEHIVKTGTVYCVKRFENVTYFSCISLIFFHVSFHLIMFLFEISFDLT